MGKPYEQLTAEERAAIRMIKVDNCSAPQIALTLRRAPSTISREVARFGAWQDRPASTTETPWAYDARAAGLRAQRARFKKPQTHQAGHRHCALWCGPALPGPGWASLADRGHTNVCGPMNPSAPSTTRASTPACTPCLRASCAKT